MMRYAAWLILAAVAGCVCSPVQAAAPEVAPHVVFVVNEDEYQADKTVPAFAAWLAKNYRCCSSVLLGQGNQIRGLETLKTADVMVVFVRRKTLPREQLAMIREYVDSGRPLVALRTACHAFALAPWSKVKPSEGSDQWPTFDVDVLGYQYKDHYANKVGTDVEVVKESASHPILAGIDPAPWHSTGSLYRMSPVQNDATVLMVGKCGTNVEPVAWTRSHRGGRVFNTSLGHLDDFALPQFQRLLAQGIFWAMNRPLPPPEPSKK